MSDDATEEPEEIKRNSALTKTTIECLSPVSKPALNQDTFISATRN